MPQFLTLLVSIFLLNSCKAQAPLMQTSQTQENVMQWNGEDRTYITYIPRSIKASDDIPLLFALHGGGGTAKNMSEFILGRFDELAEEKGFIVVYPQGIDKQWNDGRGLRSVRTMKENTDDVGFIIEIIETLSKDYNIDRSKIFTSGISNGGFMSTRLACDRPDIFKGAAIVTASLSRRYLPKCQPSNAISMIVFNGTDDQLVPYEGGQVRVLGRRRGRVLSTDDYFNFWKEKNQCQKLNETINLPDLKDDGTTVSLTSYTECNGDAKMDLYTIHGGGHTWPGGKPYLKRIAGNVSQEINACDLIWEFFTSL